MSSKLFTKHYYATDKDEEVLNFDQDVIDAFVNLGDLQRYKPEGAMIAYQRYIGGGVMSNALEHAGDIIHRITHHAKYNSLYRGYAENKAEIVLDRLKSGYGFVKEHEENLTTNALCFKIDPDEFRLNSTRMLKAYAEAHGDLPTYNSLQQLCKMGCVHLANLNLGPAISCFTHIKNMASDPVLFCNAASTVFRDLNGKIITFDEMKTLEFSEQLESSY